MTTEVEETPIEDSDDSLLDIKELNDVEFDIPPVAPPSLESILWDIESETGSDNASLHSSQSVAVKFRSMLYHCVLQGISAQVSSAAERVGAGLPTVITNSFKYLAIGTSHGYVLNFDSEQKLCWCSHDSVSNDQGAISALAFNIDSTRLLVGFERGYILMLDAHNGDVLRRLPDVHAPQTAVLQLRFTTANNLALVGDSSGCVFSLSFTRRLGVRSYDSKCLFSGARGEVCCFEPLINGQEMLGHHILVAMATLSKVIIVSVKPRLRVLFSQQLPRISTSLPLLSWQLVLVGKSLQPVLAWGRGSELNYTRVIYTGTNRNKLRLSSLRTVQLPYTMMSILWIGNRHLSIMDTGENIRLIEVRSQKELEVIELTGVGLVYGSAHFKALAVGGGVSEAFALAGERACYNTLSNRGDQVLILGTKGVHMIKLRTWHERLLYLSDHDRWTEALNLAADEGANRDKSVNILLEKYLKNLTKTNVEDSLVAAINCCVKQKKLDVLCNELWETISSDIYNQNLYHLQVAEHIINGSLNTLYPAVTQALVGFLEKKDLQLLNNVLLSLDVTCLDLHQVLKICRLHKLYESWIYITTKTIGDYTSPLIEFLSELTPANHSLGNTLLVYVSACLAGLGYPKGNIPIEEVSKVKCDILRCLEAMHSINGDALEQVYPYLRALLKYNIRECLNVVKLAFTESEFSGEMGLLQRQRLISILIQIVIPPEFDDAQVTMLACFIAKLISSNNLQVEEETLSCIVRNLSDATPPLSLRIHTEREQAWLDLLETKNLTHISPGEILKVSLKSGCFRVAEYIYELENDYSNMFACYLNDPIRCSDIFGYISAFINVPKRFVKEQFTRNFKTLVQIDAKKCVDIVVEHYANSVDEFYALLLENEDENLYTFLKELFGTDLKINADIAEKYLEILCQMNDANVCSFLKMSYCRVENALEITRKYEIHTATAMLLETKGEYQSALQLLLENDLAENAVDICIKGADHLDAESSQALWLTLLKHSRNCKKLSLRQLLHYAAPHVPPAQLLELVSDVSFGDIKLILHGMLTDCRHDAQMLGTTLKLLGKDLHQNLATSLFNSRRGLTVHKLTCHVCQTALLQTSMKIEKETAIVWHCGHCVHKTCIAENRCPCFMNNAPLVELLPSRKRFHTNIHFKSASRPDLEGHF